MPDNNILISAQFDLNELDKQMKRFSQRFRTALNNSLKNLKIDLSSLKGVQTIPLTVKVDLSQAKKDIDAFRQQVANNPITITTKASAPTAQQSATTAPSTATTLAPTLNQTAIDAATQDLEEYKRKLREAGLTTKEIDTVTKNYVSTLRTLQNTLDTLAAKQGVRQFGGAPGGLTSKDIENSQVARTKLESLRSTIRGASVDTAKLATETKRADEFMDSFGFRVGILGFGFGLLGGHLLRITQNLTQFYTAAAKATEPLQRLTNLLTQETRLSPDQRGTIFAEINRLADLPGANLDAVVKSFRALASLKLGDDKVLRLVEGITKATALTGTGAEGTARLIEQFRQFIQSGVLTERDVRTISEQGGVKITDALKEAFGTTDASKLEEIGAIRVIDAISDGLAKLETPLETSTDKLNRLENSFTRVRAGILKLVDPGMEQLINAMKTLEGIVARVVEAFEGLSPDQQAAIGKFIVAIPIITGLLGGLLTTIGALLLALATFNQAAAGLAVLKTTLAPVISSITGLFTTASKAPLGFGMFGAGAFQASKATGIVATLTKVGAALAKIATTLSVVGAAIALIIAYITDSGLVKGAIDGAFTRLGKAVDKLTDSVKKFLASDAGKALINLFNSLIDLIGTLANFFTDVLASALVLVIDLVTLFVNLVNNLFETINNPSVASFENLARTLFDQLSTPITNLGKLLAASFIDALADLAENRLTKSLFGGVGAPIVAKGLRDVSAGLKEGITSPRLAKLGAEIEGLDKNSDQAADTVKTLSKNARELNESLGKLANGMAESAAKLRIAQFEFQRDLRLSTFDRDFDRQLQANPNINVQQALQPRANIIRQTQDVINATQLNQISQQAQQGIVTPFTGSKDIQSGTLRTLEVAFQQLDTLAKSGNQQISLYRKQLDDIVKASNNLRNALAEPTSSLNQLLDTDEKQKKFRQYIDDQTAQAENIRKVLDEIDNKQQQIENENTRFIQDQLEKQAELNRQQAAESRQQVVRLELQRLQNRLLDEEEELERRIRNDLPNQLEQETKIRDTKLEIVAAEERLAKEGITLADALREQQIINERIVKTEEAKANAARETARRIREQAQAAGELFRNSVQTLTTLTQQLRELKSVPFPFAQQGATGAFEFERAIGLDIKQLNDTFKNLFRDSTGVLRTQIESLFNNVEDVGTTTFENIFDKAVTRVQNLFSSVQERISASQARQRIFTQAGDQTNLDKEVKAQEQLNIEAGEYAKILDLINKLFGIRGQLLDSNLQKQLTELNQERVNLEFIQESLELAKQQADLEQRRNVLQAQTGQVGFGDILKQISKERKEADAAEIRALHQKYALLRNELDIREAILLTEAQKAGKTEEELNALRELFAQRRKLLGEQEKLETTVTTGEQTGSAVLDSVNALNEAFERQYGLVLRAADALTSYFNRLASGEGIVGAFASAILKTGQNINWFREITTFAAAAFGSAFTKAFSEMIQSGEGFTESFGKFLGQLLIMLGEALLQMGIAALAVGLIKFLFGDVTAPALSTAAAAAATAAGIGLIVLGTAIGGGSSSKTTSANTGGKADASTGAQRNTFEPKTDPRLVFQKALMAQIEIDIKTDEGQIVKTVIKHVNQNGRLTRLIGNRKLQFGY